MSPAQVVSINLRRAMNFGDLNAILTAVETALDSPAAVELREEAADAFNFYFWSIAEDPEFDERLSALNLRLCPD